MIIKAKTDLKQKNETLAAIQKKHTVCQKAIKVSKTTVAQLELGESKVSINVHFWKELMNKLCIQEYFSCKLFFIVYHEIYNSLIFCFLYVLQNDDMQPKTVQQRIHEWDEIILNIPLMWDRVSTYYKKKAF